MNWCGRGGWRWSEEELTINNEWGIYTTLLKIYPDLSGGYEVFGSFVPIRDLKLEGDQVTFSIDLGFSDQTFQMDFKGTLQDGSLTGNFISPWGEQPVTGKIIVSEVKPEAPQTEEKAPWGVDL